MNAIGAERWIDLTMPIEDHVRWKPQRSYQGDLSRGDPFRATMLQMSCHAFTHVDAPAHVRADGASTMDIPLERLIGIFHVIDLSSVIRENYEITPDDLEAHRPDRNGTDVVQRVILKTCWNRHHSYRSKEFWTHSPYLNGEAALWLAQQEVTIYGFDFPQDYPIRGWALGFQERSIAKHVTHHYLLMKGVTLLEYITNTSAIVGDKVWGVAAPLAIHKADGAPCRFLVRDVGAGGRGGLRGGVA